MPRQARHSIFTYFMNLALRSVLVFLFDILAMIIALVGSYHIRFNFDIPYQYFPQISMGVALLVVIHALACWYAGLYRGMWIFASLPDLRRVLKAVAISSLALFVLVAMDRTGGPVVPRSVLVLYPILLLVAMGGGRVTWRMWREHRLYGDLRAAGKPVVIVGAGTGGATLVRELERNSDWRVVALIDDDSIKWGRDLYGHRVVGGIENLPQTLQDFKAQHVILAMPSASTSAIKRAADIAVRAGAHVFTVPGIEDLMNGKVTINAMRPIEIEDLLGREPVSIDTKHVHGMIDGKTVLVTGAGGSIGSELCRQLARFSPLRIVLFEASEFALYNIDQWFSNHQPGIEIIPIAGDVKDAVRLKEVFSFWKPQLVFHTAAYKHVPLMEVHNAWQAVRNNVLGTALTAQYAQQSGVERFVLVSTDKAVNPTNVMGATKRLAEMVCQAFSRKEPEGTQFEMVRFGNVLGSTGSVIPKFAMQIAQGGPVTVTHPEVTRYFMSIPEAAQLVLQAASMGDGGEIFVLDMGKPVRIVDLAKNMIRLSGYTEEQIRIEFTGLRPGEKLFEELLAHDEFTRETHHPKLRISSTREVSSEFLEDLMPWLNQDRAISDEDVRTRLTNWIPEYVPSNSANDLCPTTLRDRDT